MISKKMPLVCMLWVFLLLPPADAKQRQEAERKSPAGSIRIFTDIPNLKVFINGEAEGLAHPDRPLQRDHIPAGKVRIRVRAKNYTEKKQTINLSPGQTAELTFQFLPTSPEPVNEDEEKHSEPKTGDGRIREISELLDMGDKFFDRQRYLVPKRENAFEMYKSVLAAEPENAHAREKIYEMIGIYEKKGTEDEDKNLERALSYHKNRLTLIGFAMKNMKDTGRQHEHETLKKQVKEMEARIRKAEELVKEGDIHFIAQRYTTPKDKNAFSLYKAALKENPTHDYAKKQILEIGRIYKEWAQKARRDRNKAKARKYHRQYLPIEQYISEHFGNTRMKTETAVDIRSSLDPSREIESLLNQGAEYVRGEQFAGSGKKNALYAYQQILRLDPQNDTALKKIREMMKICHAKGLSAFEKGKYDEAGSWFDQYIQTADYAAESRKISVPKTEIAQIRQLRADTEHHVRTLELETMRDTLKKNYDQYRELRTKEDSGFNVAVQIMPVMREIISNLNRLEQLYEKLPEKEGDSAEKTDRVRNLRLEMEKEVAAREGGTH